MTRWPPTTTRRLEVRAWGDRPRTLRARARGGSGALAVVLACTRSCSALVLAYRTPAMVAHVETKEAFDALLAEAAAAGRAVVVDFTATWCGPCKQIAPIFEQLAREFPQATLVKVDVDANQETAQFCQISAMPTFKVYRDQKEVGMIRGANPAALKELIAKHAGDKFVGAGQTLGGGEGTAAAESSAPAMTEREKRLAALERRGL